MLSPEDRRLLSAASILARRRAKALRLALQHRSRRRQIEHAKAAGEENGLWALAERPTATVEDVAELQQSAVDALAIAVTDAIADPAVPARHAVVLAWLLGHRSGLLAGGPVANQPVALQSMVAAAGDRRDAAAAAEAEVAA